MVNTKYILTLLPVKQWITVITAILTPNRTFLVRFCGLSGKFGRSSNQSYSGETYSKQNTSKRVISFLLLYFPNSTKRL